jgi:hypothetical protein
MLDMLIYDTISVTREINWTTLIVHGLNKLYRKSYRNISQKDNQTLFRKNMELKVLKSGLMLKKLF